MDRYAEAAAVTGELRHITLTLGGWSRWEGIGNGFTSDPATVWRSNGNKLDQLAHRSLTPSGWSDWEIIGGGFL